MKYSVFLLILFSTLAVASARITQKETVSLSGTEAVAGTLAKLPCDTKPPVSDDRVHLVIWYKEPSDSPIYSVDARGSKAPEQAFHWSDDALGNRVSFRLHDVPSQLTIQNVKDTDGGVYRCRVDFKKSPTRNINVNLTVIIPPIKVAILDESGEHITNFLGPYNEGVHLNITCVSIGGRPLPAVTWWQENALLDDTFEALSKSRVRNTLYFGRLERHHLHTALTCQAANNIHTAPASTAVTVDMNLRPLWVKLDGENRPLSAGKNYEISCIAVGARPTPVISWWKGSIPMRNTRDKTSNDGNITTSTLKFVPTIEDSGKILSCRAATPLIAESAMEDSWKLNIHHVPIVTLELGSAKSNMNISYAREGTDVFFECNVKSNPWIHRVTWKHNGQDLWNNASDVIIVANQSLVLQDVKRESVGMYTCIASNKEGDGESNSVYLDIKYAPFCKSSQKTYIGVGIHETVKINCEVRANPPDVQFIWKYNTTTMIDISPSNFSVDRTKSQLTFIPSSESDFGSFLCFSKNDIGEQREPCTTYIFPAGKPDKLNNCSFLNVTADFIELECTEGFDGGLNQQFNIFVYDSINNKLHMNTSSSESPWFQIEGLRSASSYRFELFASNSKGRSEIVILNTQTLKLETNSLHLQLAASPVVLQLTPLLGVVMGIIASLVLVAVAILLALRCRGSKKQHSRLQNGKKSAESVDSMEKNPDIIPLNNENKFEDNILTGQKVNSFQHNHRICKRPEKDDITYAELSLPSSVYSSLLKSNPEQTVYAQIDPSSTPLIKPTKESMV
uniref:Ig-like domain-containing protein n=1 Tax=Clastoptera arizonana TaxID=38151 RepID=A0A1B6CZ15_9HEMI